jgi:hypothetical protein
MPAGPPRPAGRKLPGRRRPGTAAARPGRVHDTGGRGDLIEGLRDRGNRRPQVIVGGVESGKTALLVRLTMMLAERGAVPIPVRLWDAQENLNFLELARTRFLADASTSVLSDADGEKVWRQLRRTDKVVVLADGLEHALVGTSAEQERDNLIRAAIRRANEDRLPLIITSRPHDPLRATEAAILTLEPLSYEAALAYLSDGSGQDERRLSWIAETADVAETPLYLQITRELHVKGLLDPGSAGQHGVVDTRGVDRLRLRLSLLETWERALISGHLCEDVPLNRAERRAAVEHLSALACVGVKRDRLEVELDDPLESEISAELQRRLAVIDDDARHGSVVRNLDVRLAAAWAAQLDLVELRGNTIRFAHSLMQAYFGSRLLDAALHDPGYRRQALWSPGPGREFLTALVLRSRAVEGAYAWRRDSVDHEAGTGRRRGSSPGPLPAQFAQQDFVALLREAAATRDDNRVLDIYAAALEIDCGAAEPVHRAIAEEIEDRWSRIYAHDPQTLETGKLALVRRFGAAARTIDGRRRYGSAGKLAYRQLYAIGCRERSRPVQLAVAQEIGAGGDAAYRPLRHVLAAPCLVCDAERAGSRPREWCTGQLIRASWRACASFPDGRGLGESEGRRQVRAAAPAPGGAG